MVRIKPCIITDWNKIESACEWKWSFESSCTPKSLIVSVRVIEDPIIYKYNKERLFS